MPHPDDDWFELPEYPVRPVAPARSRAQARRSPTFWQQYPLGSRVAAMAVVTLLGWPIVAALRSGGSSASASAGTGLIVDSSPADAASDGGLGSAASSPSDSSESLASPGSLASLAEGTLPPTVATQATAPPTAATSSSRASVATSKASSVVKPTPTTRAPAKTTSSAKAVVKPASTTPKATTAATAAKPPATVTTPRTTRPLVATTSVDLAPSRIWTVEEVQALIQQMWPADAVDKAMQIADRESHFRADVYNGWCCYGVYQINGRSHLARLQAKGLTVHDLYDPRVNIEIALELYNEQGWAPWGG